MTPGKLYLGTTAGMYSSADGASSWTAINVGLAFHLISAVSVSPAEPTRLYVGTWAGGVFRSTDGGMQWTAANRGLVSTEVTSLAADPSDPEKFLMGIRYGDVWKTDDGGTTWTISSTGIEEQSISSLAVDPVKPTTVYAASGSFVYKSADGGTSWDMAGGRLLGGTVEAVAIDPTSPQTVFAGNSHVYKSVDSGLTWNPTGPTQGHVFDLAIDPQNPSTIYAATLVAVFRSLDAGGSWSSVLPSASVVKIDPMNSAVVYALDESRGAFKSSDHGDTWVEATKGLRPASDYFFRDLAIDPRNPTTLYLASVKGVYRSVNGGSSWRLFSQGFKVAIQRISINATGEKLCAGSFAQGVFAYEMRCRRRMCR